MDQRTSEYTRKKKSSAAKVYRAFIYPLTRDITEFHSDISEVERYRCEVFFGVDRCKIFLVETLKPFLVPGVFVDDNGHRREGAIVDRQAKIGDRFFIRFDKQYPDRIDFQYTLEDRDDSFRITYYQFKSIKNKLKVV